MNSGLVSFPITRTETLDKQQPKGEGKMFLLEILRDKSTVVGKA